ncbi:hypothetical protein J7F03_06835 [Streptomyces sp. ISL-43]|uniref:hypothetical protein n=1 Tax=Streptomyces sp. ISL-43 TaxID=2819183 RepID=UPI001BEABA9E|nr:hypothetical protein [Streptomyces sp. ISL-43]MBT2446795.1 hypothetical protein [Streptomyces sp. ISL-43]
MAVTGRRARQVRRVRFTAVLVGVVLALTGFSSTGGSGSSGSSSGKSKSGGGGGCSSSKSKPKKKKSIGSGGSSTASPTPTSTAAPAHADVVTCAGPGRAKATLKVTSDSAGGRTFRVPLTFEGASGRIDSASVDITLKAGESRTVDLAMAGADRAGDVRRCVVGRIQIV